MAPESNFYKRIAGWIPIWKMKSILDDHNAEVVSGGRDWSDSCLTMEHHKK